MKTLFFSILIVLNFALFAQSYQSMRIPSARVFDISSVENEWIVTVKNTDSIMVGNSKYARMFKEAKEQQEIVFPRKNSLPNKNLIEKAEQPKVQIGFSGNAWGGGTPNDNTLAVSNGKMLLSAVNSNIYMFDLNHEEKPDSLVKNVSFNAFASTVQEVSTHQYDPKLTYDPDEDRFIFVFLAGSTSSSSDIVLCFSSSNNPLDDWYMYTLPGNPLNDTSWFDYPAMNLTKNELFLTGNLLNDDGEWQVSFKQSIIWQIDKFNGYNGEELNVRLWHDIGFGGVPNRNIHPVAGSYSLPEKEMYFLSNRNFDLQNDTLFLMHISGTQYDPETQFSIKAVLADRAYGMPPDARQTGAHRLATNDSRVLGAFLQNNKIQFVGNTIDTLYGSAGVYHGLITGFETENPICKGHIISDSIVDFGYPNISFSGEKPNDDQSIISFTYSGPVQALYPGFAAVFYEGNSKYSDTVVLRQGETYINIISGVDRWGDYSGSQRVYNNPGTVWVSGTYSVKIGIYRTNATYIAQLKSPYEMPDEITKVYDKNVIVYPNPPSDLVHFDFEAEETMIVEFVLSDVSGKLTDRFYTTRLPKGRNLISFSTQHLSNGLYFVKMLNYDTKKILYTEKVIIP